MADKEQLVKEKMGHNGIFDFTALYAFMHSWLRDEEGFGVTEEKYSEKVSGNARDIDFKWVASKTANDYLKMEHQVEVEVRGLTDVEVEIDGVKKKMNKGKIGIEFKGYIIKDQGSKWDVTPWYRFLRDFYNKYVIPARIDNMEDKIRADSKKFKDDIKAFLDQMGLRSKSAKIELWEHKP